MASDIVPCWKPKLLIEGSFQEAHEVPGTSQIGACHGQGQGVPGYASSPIASA